MGTFLLSYKGTFSKSRDIRQSLSAIEHSIPPQRNSIPFDTDQRMICLTTIVAAQQYPIICQTNIGRIVEG